MVQPIFQHLLILMVAVWTAAVVLRRFGLPTVMGELIAGVLIGPAVLDWVRPNEIIDVLAQMGIFFLMLHTGVTTKPREFFSALRSSWGVALIGAIIPFSVAMSVARAFGLPVSSAFFVGIVMTATAVVITLRVLRDLGLQDTRLARVIVASCVIDDLLTLIMFSVLLSVLDNGSFDPIILVVNVGKVLAFFGVAIAVGYYLYPMLGRPLRQRGGMGFTFVLILGLAYGLVAEAIGLHIVLGAYLAGLFLEESIAGPELMQRVEDRLSGIAYSFLGPIFFISLGFHITFEAFTGPGMWFVIVLTCAVALGQVFSAGSAARLIRFSWVEALSVGIGMCGRAEMAFILASIGLSTGAIDGQVFSILLLVTFLLNLFASSGLTACARAMKTRGDEVQ